MFPLQRKHMQPLVKSACMQILQQLAHEAAARVTNARHTATPTPRVRACTPIVEEIELQRAITDMMHADGQAAQRATSPPVLAAFERFETLS